MFEAYISGIIIVGCFLLTVGIFKLACWIFDVEEDL